MRLKGGKLLLDLSYDDFINDVTTNVLTDLEIECILTKGVTILLKSGDLRFVITPTISKLLVNKVQFGTITSDNDIFLIELDISDKLLTITIQP